MRTRVRWTQVGMFAAAMGLGIARGTWAQTEAKDNMAKDTAMAADAMAKDKMAKDEMAKDKMAKDEMAKDEMAKDGMAKDGMAKDEMAKAPHGAFTGAEGHEAKGTFEVATVSGRSELRFGRDFSVDKGPDVYVVLSKGEAGGPSGVALGKLKKFSGEQTWAIPAGTDLSAYDHVVLWCKKYNVTMGKAALASGDGMMHK